MRTAVRLGAYAGALVLAFGVAWGVGTVTGSSPGAGSAGGDEHSGHGTGAAATDGHDHGGHPDGPDRGGGAVPGGLAVTESGYTLVPANTTFQPGVAGELAFTITGSDSRPVTAFNITHDKQLHLIVVRRDASAFQHLHPVLGPDGVWRIPLTLPSGGVYRAFADFAPTGGPPLVLGTDLFAPGDFRPAAPAPSRIAQVDGYQVRLEGELAAGSPSQVVATVSRDGQPVTEPEPYLGAFGHLVALRQSDLAYLHVHPNSAAPPVAADRAGPQVSFTAEVPSAATYRLFLDFSHLGVVRTAEFTVIMPADPTTGR